MARSQTIPTLSFHDFLPYAEVEAFLKALAAARPDLARLHSLGLSREGREVWCITITDFASGAPEDKPAYLIHGNIHASELSGTHAALFTARQLLADHPRQRRLLQETAFHIVPRINPDGAEWIVRTCGYVRSRTDRSEKEPNTLYQKDMNGDGLILDMIWEHPDGTLVKDPKAPLLLIERRADSPPPYYRKVIEGEIHQWDGSDEFRVEGRSIDWNRQWTYEWRPEPEQHGAGDFPFSEPEMHHLATFIHARPNLFGILGYHTGPAGVLRAPSVGTDEQMDAGDLRAYDDLAAIASRHTGFPIIPVFKYHGVRSRHIKLYGHFPSTGYEHLGLFVLEFEMGMMQDSAGFPAEKVFAEKTREDAEDRMRKILAWWKRKGRPTPLFHEWKPFDHPQLGRVEIGGVNRKYVSNPLLPDLRRRAAGTYRFLLDHAAKRPLVRLEDVRAEAVGDGVYRLRARVANRGEFPTHITNRGRNLRRLKTVRVQFDAGEDVAVLSQQAHYDLGHLKGLTGSRTLEWFVRARPSASATLRLFGGTGGNSAVAVKF